MKVLTKIQEWGDQHHPKWLDFIRMALGLTLMWKGIEFAFNLHAFTGLMENAGLGTAVSISVMAHTIIALHLIGGLMIALGSHTRMFCLLNLPVLLVAVFYVNLPGQIFRPYSEFWFSCIVAVALICFFVEGDGIISIENDRRPVTG
jgi:putative oxidoreductase